MSLKEKLIGVTKKRFYLSDQKISILSEYLDKDFDEENGPVPEVPVTFNKISSQHAFLDFYEEVLENIKSLLKPEGIKFIEEEIKKAVISFRHPLPDDEKSREKFKKLCKRNLDEETYNKLHWEVELPGKYIVRFEHDPLYFSTFPRVDEFLLFHKIYKGPLMKLKEERGKLKNGKRDVFELEKETGLLAFKTLPCFYHMAFNFKLGEITQADTEFLDKLVPVIWNVSD
jgi:hypothetical protein